MQQMIREFENVLSRYSDNQINGINAAMEFIVKKYSKSEIDLLYPYISKLLGIAEWIVRGDIAQRYNQIEI